MRSTLASTLPALIATALFSGYACKSDEGHPAAGLGGNPQATSGGAGNGGAVIGGTTASGGTTSSTGGSPGTDAAMSSGGATRTGGVAGTGGVVQAGGVPGTSTSSPAVDAGSTCTYNGKTYPYSATWPSTDGCHECHCDGRPNAVCDVLPPCDGGVRSGPPCTYDGKSYPAGATFPSTDGCNTCECLWIWTPGVACTLKDCSSSPVVDALPPFDATAAACVYNGKTYPLDAYFQATDGCNYCHCSADGQVTCTFRQDCLRDAGVPDGGVDVPTGSV